NALYALGGSNRKLGNSKKSMDYYQKSLAIRQELNDLSGIALSNWGIAQLLVAEKRYHQALQHLEIAIANNRQLKNPYQESGALMTLAEAQLGLNEHHKAEKTANKALQKAKESNSKIAISLSLDILAKVKAAQKKYAEALNFKSAYI